VGYHRQYPHGLSPERSFKEHPPPLESHRLLQNTNSWIHHNHIQRAGHTRLTQFEPLTVNQRMKTRHLKIEDDAKLNLKPKGDPNPDATQCCGREGRSWKDYRHQKDSATVRTRNATRCTSARATSRTDLPDYNCCRSRLVEFFGVPVRF
jgi:hypothetical protein